MYDVTLQNKNSYITINSYNSKNRISGSYTKGKNQIPSFTFDIYQDNDGYKQIIEYSTLVRVEDPKETDDDKRQKFGGRVILVEPKISDSGIIYKTVTCEGWAGYLNDSINYLYAAIEGKTEDILLNKVVQQLLKWHNENTSTEAFIYIPTWTTNLTLDEYTPSYERTTWGALTDELMTNDLTYDVKEIIAGDNIRQRKMIVNQNINNNYDSDTTIKLCLNMKSLSITNNFDDLCTRVIPLNKNGTPMGTVGQEAVWVDDETAISKYGIITKSHKFENISKTSKLKKNATKWLSKNSVIKRTVSVNALDLHGLGLTVDEFEIYHTYLIDCREIGLSERLELTQITRDINNTWDVQLTFGERLYSARKYKTMR